MGKNVFQPEFGKNNYITSFLFKLKSKPAVYINHWEGLLLMELI